MLRCRICEELVAPATLSQHSALCARLAKLNQKVRRADRALGKGLDAVDKLLLRKVKQQPPASPPSPFFSSRPPSADAADAPVTSSPSASPYIVALTQLARSGRAAQGIAGTSLESPSKLTACDKAIGEVEPIAGHRATVIRESVQEKCDLVKAIVKLSFEIDSLQLGSRAGGAPTRRHSGSAQHGISSPAVLRVRAGSAGSEGECDDKGGASKQAAHSTSPLPPRERALDTVAAALSTPHSPAATPRLRRSFSVTKVIELEEEFHRVRHSPLRATKISDFQILKPISKGAFGAVYLVRKKITGDLFAVKVINKFEMMQIKPKQVQALGARELRRSRSRSRGGMQQQQQQQQQAVAAVLRDAARERNIMSRLNNPFVVPLVFSFQSSNNLFLVMPFMPGGDLHSLLSGLGALDEPVAVQYSSEIVLALRYLHGKGVIHRDLKPDNCLIDGQGHIRLTDFGLSEQAVRRHAAHGLRAHTAGRRTTGAYHGGAGGKTKAEARPGLRSPSSSLDTSLDGSPQSSPRSSGDGFRGDVVAIIPGRDSSHSTGDQDSSDAHGVLSCPPPHQPASVRVSLAPYDASAPAAVTSGMLLPPDDLSSGGGVHNKRSSDDDEERAVAIRGTPDYLAPELLLPDERERGGGGSGGSSKSKSKSNCERGNDSRGKHGAAVDFWALGVMLFEMLCGTTPFNAATVGGVFERIRADDRSDYTEAVRQGLLSTAAEDLLDHLLDINPRTRYSARQTMQHVFYDGVDWKNVREMEPPFKPQLSDDVDTSYFDSRDLQDLSALLGDDEVILDEDDEEDEEEDQEEEEDAKDDGALVGRGDSSRSASPSGADLLKQLQQTKRGTTSAEDVLLSQMASTAPPELFRLVSAPVATTSVSLMDQLRKIGDRGRGDKLLSGGSAAALAAGTATGAAVAAAAVAEAAAAAPPPATLAANGEREQDGGESKTSKHKAKRNSAPPAQLKRSESFDFINEMQLQEMNQGLIDAARKAEAQALLRARSLGSFEEASDDDESGRLVRRDQAKVG